MTERESTTVATSPTETSSHENTFLGDDVFGLYRRDTKRYPRIDRDEVNDLAEKIQTGITAQTELDTTANISAEKRRDLAKAAVVGMQARNDMVLANTGLVFHWAKANRLRGVDEMDLIQEGNIGLMRAAELFDPNGGAQFSSYATQRIRAAIADGIHNSSRTIRVPRDKSMLLHKMHNIEREHVGMTGSEPTSAELSEKMALSAEKVQELQAMEWRVDSLNFESVDQADDVEEISGIMSDPTALSVEDDVIKSMDKQIAREMVQKVLADCHLTTMEKEIAWMVFGEDQEMKTIAEYLSITIQTVSAKARTAKRKILAQYTATEELDTIKAFLRGM